MEFVQFDVWRFNDFNSHVPSSRLPTIYHKSRGIFLLIFSLIGFFTVLLSVLYWIVVRVTTQIEFPPPVHLFKMFQLIFPPAILGFIYGEKNLEQYF